VNTEIPSLFSYGLQFLLEKSLLTSHLQREEQFPSLKKRGEGEIFMIIAPVTELIHRIDKGETV
jgi:hypothetical protein